MFSLDPLSSLLDATDRPIPCVNHIPQAWCHEPITNQVQDMQTSQIPMTSPNQSEPDSLCCFYVLKVALLISYASPNHSSLNFNKLFLFSDYNYYAAYRNKEIAKIYGFHSVYDQLLVPLQLGCYEQMNIEDNIPQSSSPNNKNGISNNANHLNGWKSSSCKIEETKEEIRITTLTYN